MMVVLTKLLEFHDRSKLLQFICWIYFVIIQITNRAMNLKENCLKSINVGSTVVGSHQSIHIMEINFVEN